mgnify:CR=1 FL=1
MSDITCDCTGEPTMNRWACKATDFGFPNKMGLMHPDGEMTVAGEAPTLAEVQAAIADTGVNKMILIEDFTNGQRTEQSRLEESGADTPDGLTNVVSINMQITGKIKRLGPDTIDEILEVNCFPRLKMWFFTSTGHCFGGKTGYMISNFFTPLIMEGFGVAGYIPVNCVYQHDLTKTDSVSQDDGFLTLKNPLTT